MVFNIRQTRLIQDKKYTRDKKAIFEVKSVNDAKCVDPNNRGSDV